MEARIALQLLAEERVGTVMRQQQAREDAAVAHALRAAEDINAR